MPTTELRGVDQFFNSAGVQLAPLGFGFNNDWEVLSVKEANDDATIEFEPADFDNSLYDQYQIDIIDLIPDTNFEDFEMLVSDDGGATYEVTTYHWANHRFASGTTALVTNATAGTEAQLARSLDNGAGEAANFTITMNALDTTVNYKQFRWHGLSWSTNDLFHWDGTFSWRGDTTAINGIRFQMETNLIGSGKFVLRGRRRTPVSLISQDDWVVIEDRTGISASANEDFFWDDQVYDEIEVSIWGLVPSADATDMETFLSTDGSTFHSTSGDYQFVRSEHDTNDNQMGVAGESAAQTSMILMDSHGTSADEHVDSVTHIRNVSNTTRKKGLHCEWSGILSSGLFFGGRASGLLMANNNSLRGIRFSYAGAVTLSADRIRVRGRRLTPIGVLKQDWETIATVESTSGSTVDFTDIPVREFDELELVATDLNSDTSGQNILMTWSLDNGATYENSDYDWVYVRQSAETTDVTQNATGDTDFEITANFGSAANREAHIVMRFFALSGAVDTFPWFTHDAVATNDSGNVRSVRGAGRLDSTDSNDTDITAIRFTLAAGGNWTSGKWTLRGRRKVT